MLPTQTPLLGIALAGACVIAGIYGLDWIARTFSQTLEDDGAVYGDVVRLPSEALAPTPDKLGGRGARGAQGPSHKTMNRTHVGTGL